MMPKWMNYCSFAMVGMLGFASPFAQAETVKIGYPAPVSGPAAQIGDYAVKGAQVALEEINSQALAGKHKVELVIEDGECAPAKAASATEKLIGDHAVHALLGALCSSATMAASEITQREKIPMVVAISSADKITERGYRYVFRTTPSNGQIVRVFSDYVLNNVKPDPMAFIFEQTDWGLDGATQFKQHAEKAGVKVAGFEGVPRSVQNFLPMLTKLKAENPSATFVMLLEPQALQLMNQAAEIGLETRWLGLQTIAGSGFLDKVGVPVEGLLVHSLYERQPSDANSVKFAEAFTKMHGIDPDQYAAQAYDAMIVLAHAIRQAGADSAMIRDTLAAMTGVEGVTGNMTFDANGQVSNNGLVVEWRNKQRNIVGP